MDALAVSGGMFGTARLFSAGLGYRDRHGLARALRRDGLPPLEELAAWVRMIRWVLHWEQDHTALCEIVLAEGMDPATQYRTFKRLTRQNWREVRGRGVAWILYQLRERCHGLKPQAVASLVSERITA